MRKRYVYKAFQEPDGLFIAGVIGRERKRTISLPPEMGFASHEVPDWETSNVFIDISDDADGQKVAMQHVDDVGNPPPGRLRCAPVKNAT
jgi:hypothetical protein